MLKHLRVGSLRRILLQALFCFFRQCCHPTLGCDELEKQDMNINDEQRQEKKPSPTPCLSRTRVSSRILPR